MTLTDLQGVIEIDVSGSLSRFSNFEPMYLKYLKRFITEPTYDAFVSAMEAQDYKGIESSAHTLKGIAGNLGLVALYRDFNDIVQTVRAGKNEEAMAMCKAIAPKVQQTREAIAQLD